MPYDARATGDLLRPFHVFLSSPGDVKAERRIAEEVIRNTLGEDPLLRERFAFRVVSWDDPNAPCPTPADLNPQQAINHFRRRPAECDVVVVILWSRLGAHLDVSAHRKPDGGRYLSGTEWEYEDARAGGRRIFLYHRAEKRLLDDEDPAFEENRRQKRLVGEFLQRFRNPDGSFNGGVTPYPDEAAFRERLDSDLREELARRFGGIDPGVRDRLETLERIAEDERAARQEVHRHLDASDKTIRGLNAAIAALGAQARAEPGKPGVEHALARLAAGDAAEAIAVFDDVLERKQREGEAALKEAAAAARHKGALAKLGSVETALEAYRRAAALEPGDCWTWIEIARLEQTADRFAVAKEAALRAEAAAAADATGDPHSAAAAASEIGEFLHVRCDFATALDCYRDALAIRERLVAADPGNAQWRRDLAVSHDRIGDVLLTKGDLAAALDRYRDALAIRERLVAADPDNAEWRRDLAVSHYKIGDVVLAQGNLAAALDCYRNGLAIAERLVAADPGNAPWQSALAVSHDKIGDVLKAQGDLPAALDRYCDALAIQERLVAADPDNAGWRRELAISHDKIGDVLKAQGDLPAALDRYRAALAIAERLVAAAPRNAEWWHDLVVSHHRIGDVLKAQGDLAAALDRYCDALSIAERLVAGAPGNAQWQRALAVSHDKIGDVLQAQGDLAAALDRYRDGLAIAERLVAADPDNAEWRRDLAVSHEKIGDVLGAKSDLPAALDRYRDALAIAERLVAADPDNAEWRRELAISHCKVGLVAEARGDAAAALLAYGEAEGIFRVLVALDPTNAQWRRDLALLEARAAGLRGAGRRPGWLTCGRRWGNVLRLFFTRRAPRPGSKG